LVIRQTASPGIMEQLVKRGQLVYPCHGSHEIGKDLERKNKKDAGLK
jgi:hypothetical protein